MIAIGTSGWQDAHWHGPFYPDSVGDVLCYYTQKFRTVEINNTFYQMPTEETVRRWYEAVPDDFDNDQNGYAALDALRLQEMLSSGEPSHADK